MLGRVLQTRVRFLEKRTMIQSPELEICKDGAKSASISSLPEPIIAKSVEGNPLTMHVISLLF